MEDVDVQDVNVHTIIIRICLEWGTQMLIWYREFFLRLHVYCIHYFSPNKTSLYLLSDWYDLFGGCLLMACNAMYLVLDKIDSPNARPWSRGRF
uniref:Uncharacterized protein n=1 Tax=Oryza glumipatula TaxID=40148 RepID=A0A0E0BMT3_9ORYZ